MSFIDRYLLDSAEEIAGRRYRVTVESGVQDCRY